ncbi:hypothetical protein PG993_007280 [Apiospora rasikravindrae]|uniref:protein-tyrosine-phosphatase n=1 Tax=Apiospora rasikravindrae TaxID=990691 RepID=A0ABR1SYW1_9PEZI
MARKRTKVRHPPKGAGPAQVLPFLFVGPQNTTEPAVAAAAGITHIISLGCRPKHNSDDKTVGGDGGGASGRRHINIAYHHIGIRDKSEADLGTAALLVADIISNARRSSPVQQDGEDKAGEGEEKEHGAKVLVHCMGGVSRSPAVVAYYLMREESMSLREALGAIMKVRPAMRPNDGFLRQLKELELGLRGEESKGSLDGVESLPLETKKRQDLLLGIDARGEMT